MWCCSLLAGRAIGAMSASKIDADVLLSAFFSRPRHRPSLRLNGLSATRADEPASFNSIVTCMSACRNPRYAVLAAAASNHGYCFLFDSRNAGVESGLCFIDACDQHEPLLDALMEAAHAYLPRRSSRASRASCSPVALPRSLWSLTGSRRIQAPLPTAGQQRRHARHNKD